MQRNMEQQKFQPLRTITNKSQHLIEILGNTGQKNVIFVSLSGGFRSLPVFFMSKNKIK